MRGYSQNVSLREVRLNPSAQFQTEYIKRWAEEHEIEVRGWQFVSEEFSRPFHGANISFRRSIALVKGSGCLAVVDDASRLIDASNGDEIRKLRGFLMGQNLHLHSVLHDRPVFTSSDANFANFIKPRLHAVQEAERVREIEKWMDAVGKVPRMRFQRMRAEGHGEEAQKVEDEFMAVNILLSHKRVFGDQVDRVLTIRELLDDLKAREVPTARGKLWTSANLRKFLNQLAERNPESSTLKKVKFRRGGD
ncbi:hypothetical protein [uncultured Roseibium sp.]|uniref:hypothetical protein n=1 Tax=uncultured Roseibium sp. TaxID=1936171 RepID=UPI0032166AC0